MLDNAVDMGQEPGNATGMPGSWTCLLVSLLASDPVCADSERASLGSSKAGQAVLQGLHMALQERHVLHLHPQVARVAH